MAYEQLIAPNGVERLASVVGPLVPFSKDHTMMMWYRNNGRVDPGDFPTVFYIGDDPQTLYADVVWVGFGVEANANLSTFIGATTTLWTAGFPAAKELIFNHFCYVREGNEHRLYVNGRLVISSTQNVSAFPAPTHQYLGTDSFAADWAPHEGAYFREWDKALTVSEIKLELDSDTPVELDHLFSDVPFQADFNDSGKRGIQVPTGTLVFTGLKLDAIEVPAGKLALAGLAPDIDTYLTPPVGALGLAGAAPLAVIGP